MPVRVRSPLSDIGVKGCLKIFDICLREERYRRVMDAILLNSYLIEQLMYFGPLLTIGTRI
jgi:hypothetical protein